MARPKWLRPTAALMLVVYLGGCIKTWQPSPVGPAETIAANPDRVLLTLLDSSTVILHEPRIEDGSIVSPDGRAELTSVLAVQTRQANIFANVVVYGVAALAATYLIAWTFWGSELDLPP
jgi:hypothetical protein